MSVPVAFLPIWTISRRVCREFGGVATFLKELEASFDVEVVESFALKGNKLVNPTWQAVADRLAGLLPTDSHIVSMGGSVAPLMMALSRHDLRPRSIVAAGMWVPAGTLRAAGYSELADIAVATTAFPSSYPYVRTVTEGLAEAKQTRLAKLIDSEVEHSNADSVSESFAAMNLLEEIGGKITAPVLYLNSPLNVAGFAEMEDVFKKLVPDAEVGQLERWPTKLHEEQTGLDLASRVIPFVERVEAQAGVRPQA